mmetsp:Transcript_40776/g.105426  ORF Transcript_40776/g.105426 Transcript_40776/m.105426 type:complete len:206 (+) Transcript_40776:1045-1662(+)
MGQGASPWLSTTSWMQRRQKVWPQDVSVWFSATSRQMGQYVSLVAPAAAPSAACPRAPSTPCAVPGGAAAGSWGTGCDGPAWSGACCLVCSSSWFKRCCRACHFLRISPAAASTRVAAVAGGFRVSKRASRSRTLCSRLRMMASCVILGAAIAPPFFFFFRFPPGVPPSVYAPSSSTSAPGSSSPTSWLPLAPRSPPGTSTPTPS